MDLNISQLSEDSDYLGMLNLQELYSLKTVADPNFSNTKTRKCLQIIKL